MPSRFAPEPPFSHGQAQRTAVLLCNLGTPDAPTPEAVRRYLAQFLSDPRVVEIPALVWKPILHGIILRTRPKKSAHAYEQVWTDRGSPLAFHTEDTAAGLQGAFGETVLVDWAMRYGNPGIETRLRALKEQGCDRILVAPMYPQYCGATTATVFDEVAASLAKCAGSPPCGRSRPIMTIRTISRPWPSAPVRSSPRWIFSRIG